MSGQAHGVVGGEEDGGLGGDGDEKIKRASGGNTRTPYTSPLGFGSHSLQQHAVAVADLGGAVPLAFLASIVPDGMAEMLDSRLK